MIILYRCGSLVLSISRSISLSLSVCVCVCVSDRECVGVGVGRPVPLEGKFGTGQGNFFTENRSIKVACSLPGNLVWCRYWCKLQQYRQQRNRKMLQPFSRWCRCWPTLLLGGGHCHVPGISQRRLVRSIYRLSIGYLIIFGHCFF